MRDGITYRGSSNIGEPSLTEPDFEPHPDAGEKVWTHCPDCHHIHYRERDGYGDLPKDKRCPRCARPWDFILRGQK